MQREHVIPEDCIPEAGFRARRWARFERDLNAWTGTPEGCFAVWRAQQAVGTLGGAGRIDDQDTPAAPRDSEAPSR